MVMTKRKAQIEQWLRLIERTRLFCNTANELEELVGFSVTNRNSLARKGGKSLFMKEAIFHQLGFICNELTGMDLQSLMESYEDVDEFVERYSTRLRGESLLPQIVDYFFGGGHLSEDFGFVGKRLEEKHIAILLLMLTECLPRLLSKSGDVADIDADYRKTFALLRDICKGLPLQELPAISMMEEEVMRKPEKKSRLHLIYITNHILTAYSAISTHERLSMTNRELMKGQFIPDNLDGIWTEDNGFSSFWHFEQISNGYNMYRYELKNDQQELLFTKFFVSFYHNDNMVEAVVIHPKAIRSILSNKPIPTSLFSYLVFKQAENEMSFESEGERKSWFSVSHLVRSSHSKLFQSMIDSKEKVKVNQFEEDNYDFTVLLSAITNDHIFISHHTEGYYKVPKSLNDVLYDVQFGDNVGVISIGRETYIAIDDKNLYFNVSSEEKMAQYGIQLVKIITTP